MVLVRRSLCSSGLLKGKHIAPFMQTDLLEQVRVG